MPPFLSARWRGRTPRGRLPGSLLHPYPEPEPEPDPEEGGDGDGGGDDEGED